MKTLKSGAEAKLCTNKGEIMKRTYERLLFMIIGAFIAFCAYMVGNIDSDINAEDDGKLIECDYLSVL